MTILAPHKNAQYEPHRIAGGLVLIGYEDGNGELHAIKASSFNSLSLAPRLVMWCIAHARDGAVEIPEGARCGLSVMGADQRDLWIHCVNQYDSSRFQWIKGSGLGVPLVEQAAAAFEVKVSRRINLGGHVLHIGEVHSFGYSQGCDGLTNYLDDLSVPLLHE